MNIGDQVNLIKDSLGNWIASKSISASVGDNVKIITNSDGKYIAVKSSGAKANDIVSLTKTTDGNWIAHKSGTPDYVRFTAELAAIHEYDLDMVYKSEFAPGSYPLGCDLYGDSIIYGATNTYGETGIIKINLGDYSRQAKNNSSGNLVSVMGDYVYSNYGTNSTTMRKLNASDLTLVEDITPSFGSVWYTAQLCNDGTNFYIGGFANSGAGVIYKTDNNFTATATINFSTTYSVRGLCTDGTYLYASIRSLAWNGNSFVITGIINKYLCSDLSFVSGITSDNYGYDTNQNICTDGTYLYLARHFLANAKYKCSDLSLVATGSHSAQGANGVCVKNQFNS
jgi:hypothetical protein